MIEKWKDNPLFRLLAFLDVVGLQRFSHANDLKSDGTFINPDRTVGAGTVMHNILRSGLHALRANITRLFADEKEREQLLLLVGDPNETPTVFGEGVLKPPSLQEFDEVVDSALPVWARLRLQEAVALNTDGNEKVSSGSVKISEQFLIDAIDGWMNGRSHKENDALVLACGVKPEVLEAARGRADELPNAVEDFIIDVVFPPSYGNEAKESDMVDWLIASYEQCCEAVNAEEEEDTERDQENENNEEVLLTSENVATFMLENPSVIPKAIVRELRRKLYDPEITEFELRNHYLASELVAFAKGELGLKKGLNRTNCVKAILEHHSTSKKKTSPKKTGPQKRGRAKR
ncbi:hypothetical protein, conserved [Trypanosoma brucei gambiense DAL972]|uniref:Uncharacterized protein n=1 Tax=Trypanosoma brucei gambiense (strain MHOM/CI/86/DAL972) TaxID=679716 RepID=C9ZLD7_TRYB9|nr:hypothetical protein, conserved [Trypanosoma brucei gambiense DAL972]CBH10146.1 hypothetical protein, conserved [Trypanosoma brucei gambiense DAL972]|eukprot:XP_011772436.1 hypothetical protein, conserved [Trypanosoma brucei gambiense DAL972]